MNKSILTEIELNRKIHHFQKAVEAYAKAKNLQNAQAVTEAKRHLIAFMGGGYE